MTWSRQQRARGYKTIAERAETDAAEPAQMAYPNDAYPYDWHETDTAESVQADVEPAPVSEGRRWTIYLDERQGEPWWRVRWPGNGPMEGAEGFQVVEVIPADEADARVRELEEQLHDCRKAHEHRNHYMLTPLPDGLVEAEQALATERTRVEERERAALEAIRQRHQERTRRERAEAARDSFMRGAEQYKRIVEIRNEQLERAEGALARAADDLDKAANQFEAIKMGSALPIVNNPALFAEKARLTRAALEPETPISFENHQPLYRSDFDEDGNLLMSEHPNEVTLARALEAGDELADALDALPEWLRSGSFFEKALSTWRSLDRSGAKS